MSIKRFESAINEVLINEAVFDFIKCHTMEMFIVWGEDSGLLDQLHRLSSGDTFIAYTSESLKLVLPYLKDATDNFCLDVLRF